MAKNKEATVNPKSNNGKCFQYALTLALNHEKIKLTQTEYQKLHLSLINTLGKKLTFHHIKRTGKNLNQVINLFLLISCMYLIILKK